MELSMTPKKWDKNGIKELYEEPLNNILYRARTIHNNHFEPNEIELCTLLSIKTGNCAEDCTYCAQSSLYQTNILTQKLMPMSEIIAKAKLAKAHGATRFCMSASWYKHLPPKHLPKLLEIIKTIKNLGLEVCVTLGQIKEEQAEELANAGLDFYNHNLNTSPDYYQKIVTTHTYQDRLETIEHIQRTNIHTCCGMIIGMGETSEDRISMLFALASLPKAPKSVPINRLVPIKGTPLENTPPIDNFEFIRIVAITRILFPNAMVRLAAGRATMSDEMQALCFMAGANSIFFGDKLLTTKNPDHHHDLDLLKKLGIKPKQPDAN